LALHRLGCKRSLNERRLSLLLKSSHRTQHSSTHLSLRMRFAFYTLAAWTLGSGLLAVSMRNLMHCALALIAFFMGVAAIFFSMHADFLGAVQVIVYV